MKKINSHEIILYSQTGSLAIYDIEQFQITYQKQILKTSTLIVSFAVITACKNEYVLSTDEGVHFIKLLDCEKNDRITFDQDKGFLKGKNTIQSLAISD